MKLDLIIVDDSQLWRSIAEQLALMNPNIGLVLTFGNATDAIGHLRQNAPDIIMTDMEMPGMDGLEMIRRLKKDYRYIASSTRVGYDVIARELGCIDFLRKPFNKTAFDSAIEKVVASLRRVNEI